MPLNWIIHHNSLFSFSLYPIQTNVQTLHCSRCCLLLLFDWLRLRRLNIIWKCAYALCTRCSYTRSGTFNKIKSTTINHFGVFVFHSFFFGRFEAFTASFANWLWIKSRWYFDSGQKDFWLLPENNARKHSKASRCHSNCYYYNRRNLSIGFDVKNGNLSDAKNRMK